MHDLTPDQRRALEAWVGRLQRILQWEADHDFVNSRGRSGYFGAVLAEGLRDAPLNRLRNDPTCGDLRDGFSAYATWAPERRRRWVVRTRQWLHQQRLHQQPQPPPAQQSSLAKVKGIGPKLAAKLTGMGLHTVDDLLRHYPRDYIDYSRLLRIRALRPGDTVTVVGTVRHSHAFVSSRNHNLAILELQLQDATGRLRVTRFYVGRRFTSPKWLQRQRRLFPPGATVAASGLVKAGPYGLSLQDPLLEVLDTSPATPGASPNRRILPVYPLIEGVSAESLRRAVQAVLPMASQQPDPLTAPWRPALWGDPPGGRPQRNSSTPQLGGAPGRPPPPGV